MIKRRMLLKSKTSKLAPQKKEKKKKKKKKNRTNVCKVSIIKYNEERRLEISKFQNHLFNLRNR